MVAFYSYMKLSFIWNVLRILIQLIHPSPQAIYPKCKEEWRGSFPSVLISPSEVPTRKMQKKWREWWGWMEGAGGAMQMDELFLSRKSCLSVSRATGGGRWEGREW